MPKKRYSLYLSPPLARKFELVARQRHGSRSALFEEALRANLEPQHVPGVEEGLARRLNELSKTVGVIGRDVALSTETLVLLVRYFLTVTPPLPTSEQEPARLLGKERYDVFVKEIGRRMASDHRFVTEVLDSIVVDQPDLFAATSGRAPTATPATATLNGAQTDAIPQQEVPKAPPREGNGHG
jgi:hypothetical protein